MAGRRERNKLVRRRANRLAGLRLFAERGNDRTTLVDIAEAADVALRTVSLYYPTKLDIALSMTDELLAGALPASGNLSGDLTYLDVVERWLRSIADTLDVETLTLAQRSFERNPELGALASARIQPDMVRTIEILTEELGGPDQQFNAGLVAVAVKAVVTHIIIEGTSEDMDRTITSAWAFLRAGVGALQRTRMGPSAMSTPPDESVGTRTSQPPDAE